MLYKIMRKGLWKEKVEASKALLYIYKTFKGDIENPVETFILPQIDYLMDEFWQIRAQTALSLSMYGLPNSDLIYSLICRLKDEYPAVR
jgi:hypothetical protein